MNIEIPIYTILSHISRDIDFSDLNEDDIIEKIESNDFDFDIDYHTINESNNTIITFHRRGFIFYDYHKNFLFNAFNEGKDIIKNMIQNLVKSKRNLIELKNNLLKKIISFGIYFIVKDLDFTNKTIFFRDIKKNSFIRNKFGTGMKPINKGKNIFKLIRESYNPRIELFDLIENLLSFFISKDKNYIIKNFDIDIRIYRPNKLIPNFNLQLNNTDTNFKKDKKEGWIINKAGLRHYDKSFNKPYFCNVMSNTFNNSLKGSIKILDTKDDIVDETNYRIIFDNPPIDENFNNNCENININYDNPINLIDNNENSFIMFFEEFQDIIKDKIDHGIILLFGCGTFTSNLNLPSDEIENLYIKHPLLRQKSDILQNLNEIESKYLISNKFINKLINKIIFDLNNFNKINNLKYLFITRYIYLNYKNNKINLIFEKILSSLLKKYYNNENNNIKFYIDLIYKYTKLFNYDEFIILIKVNRNKFNKEFLRILKIKHIFV